MTIFTLLILGMTGALTGIVAGLFGVGGGIIVVPVLYHLLPQWIGDTPYLMHTAVGTSLMVVALTGLSSARAHLKTITLSLADIAPMMLTVIIGSALGAWFSHFIDSKVLAWAFGVFELLIAAKILSGMGSPAQLRSEGLGFYFGGGVIGFISSLMGIGGGTLMTPWQMFFGRPIKRAIAFSVVLSLPIAAAGALGYAVFPSVGLVSPWLIGHIFWPAALAISAGSMLLAPVGAKWAHAMPQRRLKLIFGLFLVIVGIKMLT